MNTIQKTDKSIQILKNIKTNISKTNDLNYTWLYITGLIYLLLHFMASQTTSPLFWGIDSWRYLPEIFPYLFLTIGILSFLPGFQKAVSPLFKKTGYFFKKIPLILWLLIAGMILYLFRQSTFFLGDGLFQIRQTELGELFSKQEPYFDIFIHSITYKFLNQIIGISGKQVYQWMSVFCGILTFSGILLYLKQLFEEKENRLFLGSLLITTGSVQLFFGYVEVYTFVNCFLIFFLLSTLLMLKRGKNSFIPGLFLATATIFHPQAIMLIPGALYAYYVTNKKNIKEWLKPLSGFICIIAVFVFIFAIFGFTPADFFKTYTGGGKLLPLISNDDIYGILSLNHFLDCLNEIILIAPVSIFLVFIILRIKDIRFSKSSLFLLLCSLGVMFFMAVFHARIGYARDWDLFAFSAFPLTILTGILLLVLIKKDFPKYAFPIFTLILLHTVPWIFINSNESLSIKRFENIAGSKHWSNYAKGAAYDELRSYFFAKGEYDISFKYAEEAYKYSKSSRYLNNIAALYNDLGEFDKAIGIFKILLKDDPEDPVYHLNIGIAYIRKNLIDNAIPELKTAIRISPNLKTAHFHLGMAYKRKGLIDEAISEFLIEKSINPNDLNLLLHLGIAYGEKGKIDEAIIEFKNAIKINPNDEFIYLNLGVAYSFKGEIDKSIKELENAIELKPDFGEAHFLLSAVYIQNKNDKSKGLYYLNQAKKYNFDPAQIKELEDFIK